MTDDQIAMVVGALRAPSNPNGAPEAHPTLVIGSSVIGHDI
jgi:hypothetical protein